MKREKSELLKKIHGGQTCQIVATASRLGLFDALEEPASCLSLAERLSLDCDTLRRLLFALVALYLLEYREDGTFVCTAQGRYLTDHHSDSIKDLAIYKGSSIVWDALSKLYDGVRTNTTPFELQFGKGLFEHLEACPEDAEIFHNAMDCYLHQASKKLLEVYDFSLLQSVLDVGGGTGSLGYYLKQHYSSLDVAVFDLPHILRQRSYEGVRKIAGSFFDAIPSGYDGYILRNILHDWSDEQCVAILRNCRLSLNGCAKLLIMESLIDPTSDKRLGKLADITMFVMTSGGQERSFESFAALIEEAGLRVVNVYKTMGAKALLECEAKA